MENVFTNKLEEKIYYGNQEDLIQSRNELNLFFKELVKRKRNEPIEGGLQASIVIYDNSFAAKVNELDGKGTHIISEVNLTKFLNNNNHYLTEKAARNFGLYFNEINTITKLSIIVRILNGENKLMVLIASTSEVKSNYKLDILEIIVMICKKIKEDNYYKEIDLEINIPNLSFNLTDFNKTNIQAFINTIKNKKEINNNLIYVK